jgi:hypothetical protein
MKKALAIAMIAAFANSTLSAYAPVLEAKVVCLSFGERLDAAKFQFHTIEPLRQGQTCYVLVDYLQLPPEKARAAKDAARMVHTRLGQGKK